MGGQAIDESNVLQYRSDVVREMVDEMLLVAKAHRDSIYLAPGAVNEELDRRVAELEERHGSPEALDEALVIEGLKRENLAPGRINFLCMERTFGSFRRMIPFQPSSKLRIFSRSSSLFSSR